MATVLFEKPPTDDDIDEVAHTSRLSKFVLGAMTAGAIAEPTPFGELALAATMAYISSNALKQAPLKFAAKQGSIQPIVMGRGGKVMHETPSGRNVAEELGMNVPMRSPIEAQRAENLVNTAVELPQQGQNVIPEFPTSSSFPAGDNISDRFGYILNQDNPEQLAGQDIELTPEEQPVADWIAKHGDDEEGWVNNLKSEQIVGYRYGKAPEGGRSYNTKEQKYEDGVSLASALGGKEIGSFAVSGAKGHSKKYYIGEKIGFGGDDEHLISNAKEITKKEYDSLVKSPTMLAEKLKFDKEKLDTLESLRRRNYSPYNTEYGENIILEKKKEILETESSLRTLYRQVQAKLSQPQGEGESEIKASIDSKGNFTMPGDILTQKLSSMKDTEIIDLMRWARTQSAHVKRNVEQTASAELRERRVPVDEIKWQISKLSQPQGEGVVIPKEFEGKNPQIIEHKGIKFLTTDNVLGGGNYKDIRVWDGEQFSFMESKRGFGKFSSKDLDRISENAQSKLFQPQGDKGKPAKE